MKVYCQLCDSMQPFILEPMVKDELNSEPWGDLQCQSCLSIIATFTAEYEGRAEIRLTHQRRPTVGKGTATRRHRAR